VSPLSREERLVRAASKATAAREALEREIREAAVAGMSLRQIAPLVGLSREWTRRIASGTARKEAA
jgi:hypothetical protein